MSQVIVTDDELHAKREHTREQEKKISTEEYFQHWRMADINRYGLIAKAVGLAFLPVVFFWALLLTMVGVSVTVFTFILGTLGRFFRRRVA